MDILSAMQHARLPRLLLACLTATLLWTGAATAQGLPPTVEADRQLQLASGEMEKEDKGGKADWPKAAAALKAAEATGVPMPANFDYHYGRALQATGQHAAALERLERYLRVHGTKGKYYSQALQLYTSAQAGKATADEAARQRAALDAAWVDVKTTWWNTDDLDDGCERAEARIERYAPSARNLDCSCQTGFINHPAWRDHQEITCTVTWQGNLLQEKRESFSGERKYRTHSGSGSVLEGMRSRQQ